MDKKKLLIWIGTFLYIFSFHVLFTIYRNMEVFAPFRGYNFYSSIYSAIFITLLIYLKLIIAIIIAIFFIIISSLLLYSIFTKGGGFGIFHVFALAGYLIIISYILIGFLLRFLLKILFKLRSKILKIIILFIPIIIIISMIFFTMNSWKGLDIEHCLDSNDPSELDMCMKHFAEGIQNPKDCFIFKGIGEKISIIDENFTIYKCYELFFSNIEESKKNNLDICDDKNNPEWRDFCYIKLVRLITDEKICESLSNEQDKISCFKDLINRRILEPNREFCEKGDIYFRSYCYELFAKSKNDETLCEEVHDIVSKNGCYFDIAVLKKDKSICKEISLGYRVDACINKIAENN